MLVSTRSKVLLIVIVRQRLVFGHLHLQLVLRQELRVDDSLRGGQSGSGNEFLKYLVSDA
jgi:hypothetical protein